MAKRLEKLSKRKKTSKLIAITQFYIKNLICLKLLTKVLISGKQKSSCGLSVIYGSAKPHELFWLPDIWLNNALLTICQMF